MVSSSMRVAAGIVALTFFLTGCLGNDDGKSTETACAGSHAARLTFTPEPPPALAEQAAGLLVVGFRGQNAAEANVILEDICERRIGGVILFDRDVLLGTTRNIDSPAQLTALVADLQEAAGGRLLVAIDQEGGAVNRLNPVYGFPETHSARHFGDLDDDRETAAEAQQVAGLLKALGIHANFAPVVDLDIDPESPAIGRWGRSYSADPEVVVRHAREVMGAHSGRSVATALKHFPGHGSASTDSHLGFTDVTHTWQATELEPYRQLLGSANQDTLPLTMVMTAHIFHEGLDADHPATLSRAVVTDLLRDELGFEGVVVSDDMQMGAITDHYGLEQALELSLNAGVDLLVFANNLVYQPDIAIEATSIIVQLVEEGRVPASRVEEAWQRVCALKQGLGLGC